LKTIAAKVGSFWIPISLLEASLTTDLESVEPVPNNCNVNQLEVHTEVEKSAVILIFFCQFLGITKVLLNSTSLLEFKFLTSNSVPSTSNLTFVTC